MAEKLEKPSGELPQGDHSEQIHKTADPRLHSAKLDALRGFAILSVVVAHAKTGWDTGTGKPLSIPLSNTDLLVVYINYWGSIALALFFLLSGYLLTWTEGRRASKGGYSVRSYAFRRALRLLPAYYVALALIIVLHLTDVLKGEGPTFASTLVYLGMLQSFVPISHRDMGFDPAFWSLTPELVFYALLPLLVLKIRGLYGRLALFGVLAAASVMINIYMFTYPDAGGGFIPAYLYLFPLTHLWIFIAGVLLRMLVERLEEKRPGGSWPALGFSLFASFLVLLPLLPYLPFLGEWLTSTSRIVDGPSILTLVAALLFVAALLGSPILTRILSWRLLGFVGVISYSLFLLHNTFIDLTQRYVLHSRSIKPLIDRLDGPALWLAFAGYLGAILVVAGALSYLSYRYIESPFLRIKPK